MVDEYKNVFTKRVLDENHISGVYVKIQGRLPMPVWTQGTLATTLQSGPQSNSVALIWPAIAKGCTPLH